jgi:hypothetical protein
MFICFVLENYYKNGTLAEIMLQSRNQEVELPEPVRSCGIHFVFSFYVHSGLEFLLDTRRL